MTSILATKEPIKRPGVSIPLQELVSQERLELLLKFSLPTPNLLFGSQSSQPKFASEPGFDLLSIHGVSPTFDAEELRLRNRSTYGKARDIRHRAIIIMLPNLKKSNPRSYL